MAKSWKTFRGEVLDVLDTLARDRLVMISRDHFVAICPCCCADLPNYVGVQFHATTSRVTFGHRDYDTGKLTLGCTLGCTEEAIATAIGQRLGAA
jgi:hypothetical protein